MGMGPRQQRHISRCCSSDKPLHTRVEENQCDQWKPFQEAAGVADRLALDRHLLELSQHHDGLQIELQRDLIQLQINLFGSQRGPQLWQVNGLMLVNTILMGVVVGVGAYAPRYSRHPVIGSLHLGATILFLPIMSLVATTVGNQHISSLSFSGTHITSARCSPLHIILALIWTGVVLIIGINTRAIVATDEREGRSIGPPTELLIKAIWTAYLTLSTIKTVFRVFLRPPIKLELIVVQLFVIIFTKLLFKYSIFFKAQQSFAFRRSPRLIAGYMAQLQQLGENQWATARVQHVSDEHEGSPPALVVMGEDKVQVEKQPHGYNFKSINSKRLVTLDRIWRLNNIGSNLLGSSPTARPKDVCFSFALFKLLRCRFANYTVFEAGFLKAHKFFLRTLLHGDNFQRVFGVIEDELSFIHDYYYSSLPISYSHHLLPLLSVALSLYSTAYCLYLIAWLSKKLTYGPSQQIICIVSCSRNTTNKWDGYQFIGFGSVYFDAIPLYLVLAALVLAEIRDIVFYMCSNWTKVALICGYVHHASWQQSPAVQKLIGFVLKHFRSKLVHSWADKMNQCSILLKQRQWVVSIRLRRLLCLPNQKKIKVPSAVKEGIFKALKCLTSEEGLVLEHIRPPSPPISGPVSEYDGGNASPSAHDGKHIAYTILLWHIATSVFEMGHPQPSDPECHKIAATHLSRYCAYLVSCSPDLLPDDDEWCKQLYKDVKKDADRILSTAPKAAEYEQLVQLLSVDDLNHEVLKNGARLGKKLVDSSTGWEELARFWSEVILYVAPSENLEGHADAIARGGELITLLWTLLQHAGIVGRLDAGDLSTGGGADDV